MKLIIIIAILTAVTLPALADSIVCSQGDRPISIEIEYESNKVLSKMTVMNYGEKIFSGNAKITKRPSVNDGETIFSSTSKAEGNFTNGELPSWKLILDGNGQGIFEVLSDKLQKKLSMFETNETLYCK